MFLWQRLKYDIPREGEGTGTGGGDAKPWYDGNAAVTPELVGHWQNRGLHDKTPAEIAIAASIAHREAEKLIGAPANEMLRLPKDANAPEWGGVWERLGRPKEAKDYDFSAVKRSDGQAPDQATLDHYRNLAFTLNLPKDAATRYVQESIKHQESVQTAATAINQDKVAEEKVKLADNWKSNFEANMVIAKAGAAKLGVSPEAVDALEKVVGYAEVMDIFRKVGMSTTEATFVQNNNTNLNGGMLTKEQATARKSELKADSAWVTRFLAGGTQEAREIQALDRILAA